MEKKFVVPPYTFHNQSCVHCDFPLHFLLDSDVISMADSPPSLESRGSCGPFFNVYGNGRLGNLMFEYATAVGVCVFRNLNPKTCARISLSPGMNSSNFLPLDNFLTEFKIPELETCRAFTRIDYAEHSGDGFKLLYDPYVLSMPASSFLRGYFQSYRYFYPHADRYIKTVFQFTGETLRRAEDYMKVVRNKIAHKRNWADYELVCMAVRRGDKTNENASPIYSKWALSAEYYKLAIKSVRQRFPKKNIAVFITVGGSFNVIDNENDRQWLRRNIIIPLSSKSMQFIDDFGFNNANPFVTMKLLSSCPSIVISSSSFSWWAAFLSNDAHVVAPKNVYSSNMKFSPSDYYPPGWELIEEPKPISIFRLKRKEEPTHQDKPKVSQTLGSDYTTVVTSYYKIPSKYNHTLTYMKWITNFMAMDFKCVIFVDVLAHSELSIMWPPTSRRLYKVKELSDFESSRGSWDWNSQELLDPERHVGHNSLLYKLWSEKIFMVADIVKENPYGTGAFAWTDIGAFRNHDVLPMLQGYPDPTKFNLGKVTFPQIEHFSMTERQNINVVDKRFIKVIRIGGGHFSGSGAAIMQFSKLYRKILTEFQEAGVFFGKDQSLFAYLILRHPYLFDTVYPTQCPGNYDIWFCIQFYWSGSAAPAGLTHNHMLRTSKLSAPTTASKCRAHFLILSTSESFVTRNALRTSWLSRLSLVKPVVKFRYHFVVGRNKDIEIRGGLQSTARLLSSEIETFQDIIILPFWESYNNFTVKVALMLKWAARTYPDCPYIFKVDDDVVFRTNALSFFLRNLLPSGKRRVYGGYFYDQKKRKTSVNRDPKSRSSLTLKEFPYSFSPYVEGPFFISTLLVKQLPYGFVYSSSPFGVSKIDELVPDFFFHRHYHPLSTFEDAFFGHFIWQMPNVAFVFVESMFPSNKDFSRHARLMAARGIKSPEIFLEISNEEEIIDYSVIHKALYLCSHKSC